jgi:hypothetical protein
MALKPDRRILDTRIDYFMNAVAEDGGVPVIANIGSGASMDNALQTATYAANPSGRVALGILLNNVVNKDLVKTHLNFYRDEVQVGGKVTILEKGYVVTDFLVPGLTISGGQTAYLGASGRLTNTQANSAPVVGRFETNVDEDGFVKVSVNLP